MSKAGPNGSQDLSKAYFQKGRLGIGHSSHSQLQNHQFGEQSELEFEEYLKVAGSNEMNMIHPNQSLNLVNEVARDLAVNGPMGMNGVGSMDVARNWKNEFTMQREETELHGSSSTWKKEFFAAGPRSRNPVPWVDDFHRNFEQQDMQSHHQWNEEFERVYASNQLDTLNHSSLLKGKQIASMTEVDWIREFEEMKLAVETGIPRATSSWVQEFNEASEVDARSDQVEEWQTQFEELWKRMKETEIHGNHNWEKEFQEIMPDSFPTSLLNESAFDGELKKKDLYEADPVLADCTLYTFEPVNPYLEHPNPFQAGLDIINSPSGSLTAACLAFEAAVQRDSSNDEVWQRLGMAQAENEKEGPAIAALQRCVQENPKNLQALMSLAVSYTNEGQIDEAYASLYRWITTRFPEVPIAPLDSSIDQHAHLVNTFLHHINSSSGEGVDADIQIGLGILFYNIQDYEKTIDCFKAAVAARPDDYLMWNRLGATLSNSGDNEGAIEAYWKVLSLKPSFVRGRYNLGVSCMNIGCFREAAEHFLAALSLHETRQTEEVGQSGNGAQVHVSKTLWDTLHRNFIMMDRRDLADLALRSQDLQVFRKEFKF